MKRGKFFCSALLALALLLGSVPEARAEEGFDGAGLYAASACLMDGDSGRVLFGKEADTPLPMASTTKIMTCIVTLETIENPSDMVVTASAKAAAQPEVHLGVREGQRFYLQDLLYSLMLESHNDAAVMIAEAVGGSVEGFAAMMNEKAREIGCTDTHYVTPNGLDADDEGGSHHTTAADLALVMRYCIRQSPKASEFLSITQTSSHSFWDLDQKNIYDCTNHNAFLGMMDGALSGKTGFTSKAGYCYVGALQQDDRCFIVALLACGWPSHKDYKWSDTRKLMEYGLENYAYRDVYDGSAGNAVLPVRNGRYEGYPAGTGAVTEVAVEVPEEEASLRLLLRQDEAPEIRVRLPEYLEAPVYAGAAVGEVEYILEGEVLSSWPVRVRKTVEEISYPWCLGQMWKWYCGKT